MFTQLFPILSTPDVQRALGFYRDLLGAEVTFEFPGPDGKPAYVGLELGASHLGIGLQSEPVSGSTSLWVYADDCDAAVDRLRAAGVAMLEEAADQPWGERVARVEDPDGNVVIVGAAAASS
jgi:lactoylglutathione lyase